MNDENTNFKECDMDIIPAYACNKQITVTVLVIFVAIVLDVNGTKDSCTVFHVFLMLRNRIYIDIH